VKALLHARLLPCASFEDLFRGWCEL